MKIQSDGKGYGNLWNPYDGTSQSESFLYAAFEDHNPTLPIYLPNGDPYLGDDVVEGEEVWQWYCTYHEKDDKGRPFGPKVAKWRDVPNYNNNVDNLAESLSQGGSDTRKIYRVHPVLTEQAEVKTDISNRAKSNRRVIQLIFEDSNRISYYPTIAILDFYQDKDRLSYKKSDVIKLRDFLNQLPL